MTPEEQDEELREELDQAMHHLVFARRIHQEDTLCMLAVRRILKIIKAEKSNTP